MDRVRNGRVIIDNIVHDIMLPSNGSFVFDFSVYLRPYNNRNVFCIDANTIGNTALEPGLQQNIPLLDEIIGYENYNLSSNRPKKYKLVQKDFDILSNVNMVYAHPSLDDILSQLNLSSLTPVYMAGNFNLKATGEKVPMEVMHKVEGLHSGRTAAFEQPITLNGELYLLEVKGVNYGDMPLKLEGKWNDAGDCTGGLAKGRMEDSVEILKHLNTLGYGSTVLVAAYQIPGLRQFDGQELGAYVRAVKCSPSIAHYSENLPKVAESLGWSRECLAEYAIRCAARDMATIWKAGVAHDGPVHEQNIRIGSITDFTASNYVRKLGFNSVVHDAASFTFSCQKIMEKLADPIPKADEDRAECYFAARGIITDELNNQLGLNLPRKIGTASLSAEIYNMQKQLGLTNPDEKITVEYDMVAGMEYERYCSTYYRTGPGIGAKFLQLFGKEPKETIKYLQVENLLIH
ncbi:MAG: hypothetical protein V1831_04410 [Candidatus Woesearchaeota archaeon]